MAAASFILSQSLPIRWEEPWLLPAVLGLGAAIAAAVLWFYPHQLRNVRRPWRYVIPGLRLLAFTALAVSVARPIALRARPNEDRGVLVVLLDRSRSMSIADGSRKPSELVALSDALGLLPGQRTATTSALSPDVEQLQALLAQALRAQDDLSYARANGRGVEAAEARLHKQVDELRSKCQALAAAASRQDPSLREAFSRLREIPAADPRGAWAQIARQRVDRAASALARFGEQADKRLFDASPQIQRVCSELEKRSRFDLACEALLRPGGLLSRLDAQTQPLVFGFADRVTPLPEAPLAAMSAPPAGAENGDANSAQAAAPIAWASEKVPLRPDGGQTDIVGSISSAVGSVEGKPIRAVVLLSDGQQIGTAEPVGAAAYSLNLPPRVPLIAINVCGQSAPKDLAIAEINEPVAAFVGDPITVRARLRGTGGLSPDASTLRLGIADGIAEHQDLVPASVEKPVGRRDELSAWASFSVRFDRPGVFKVSVTEPAAAGEVTQENNSASRWVKVLPQPIKVVIAGDPSGPDFDQIRAALDRPQFKLQSFKLGASKGKLPLTSAQILRLDVLMLYDCPVGALSREQWQAAERLVTQRGGSVIFVAGSSMSVAAYADQPAAAALLPFNLNAEKKPAWRTVGNPPGIKLAPGVEMARFDLQQPLGNPTASGATTGRRWQDLPGLTRVLPVKSPRPTVRALLRDAESNALVAAELRPPGGIGRAIYFGSNETWRWRGKGSEAEQERFWQQLVRHAPEEPYASRKGRLALDLDHVGISAGQTVSARVRVLSEDEAKDDDESAAPPSAPATSNSLPPIQSLHLEIVKEGEERAMRTVRLTESSDSSARLRASITDLPAGSYRVRLTAAGPNAGAGQFPEVALHVESDEDLEMRNLAADSDRLKRMADSTGGRLLSLDQLSAVPGLLTAAAAAHHAEPEPWSLWDSPWLFGFVVSCLGAEWALRKRAGLA